ncbi:hypothetical protein A0J61_07563 [Choanephora cucurbitarum]|uniref:Uncharacterized protein n=1 Tax=Choanephora cucurbitarum TaxID=101091 RepID=A0A1C7N5U8_9FUNG|nr:hypothetical protein A0J61_07563 [Choanephora cucurbitarum]
MDPNKKVDKYFSLGQHVQFAINMLRTHIIERRKKRLLMNRLPGKSSSYFGHKEWRKSKYKGGKVY